jgi:hypothetical protein
MLDFFPDFGSCFTFNSKYQDKDDSENDIDTTSVGYRPTEMVEMAGASYGRETRWY